MKCPALFLSLLLCGYAAAAQPTVATSPPTTKRPASTTVDRECSCTVSKIWLDIAVIIDVSEAMDDGVYGVAAQLISVFGQLNISQQDGQFARVALVTAAGTATKLSDLTTYKDTTALVNAITSLQPGKDKTINIQAALKVVADIFESNGSKRNRKQVVLLYASAYNQGGYADPKGTALQLRDGGISIITVAYVQASETSDVLKISELASLGFAFSNIETADLVDSITNAFCQANCFCPTNWAQFADEYDTPGSHKYGVCLKYVGMEASWFAANAIGCRHNGVNGSHLVTEFSSAKQIFNQAYYVDASNQTGISLDTISYHIGLRTKVPNTSGYVWVEGNQKYVPLDTKSFQSWGKGYPNINQGDCVSVKSNGHIIQWENSNCYTDAQNYLCEAAACDTDNYCAHVDF